MRGGWRMMRALRNHELFKPSIVYGVCDAVRKLIPFLLLPILTHYLAPDAYGLLSLFLVGVALLTTIISLGSIGAVGREYFDSSGNIFSNYVAHCLLLMFGVMLLVGTGISVFAAPLTAFTAMPTGVLIAGLCIALGNNMVQLVCVIHQSAKRPVAYARVLITVTSLEMLLSLYAVIIGEMDWYGRVIGALVAVSAMAILLLITNIRRHARAFAPSAKTAGAILAFGIPLMPHLFAGLAITMTDRFLLAYIMDYEHVGLYTVGAQIGMVVGMVAAAINQAWAPWVFGKLKEGSAHVGVQIVRASYTIAGGYLLFACLMVVCSYGMFEWLIDPAYAAGWQVAIIIGFSGVFTGMYYLVGVYVTYHRKTHIHSLITFGVAVVNLVLSYILILQYGLIGAALGTLVANMVAFGATFRYAASIHPMPWAGITNKN
jgi:O-antigen/teichoic acid export membrane protein